MRSLLSDVRRYLSVRKYVSRRSDGCMLALMHRENSAFDLFNHMVRACQHTLHAHKSVKDWRQRNDIRKSVQDMRRPTVQATKKTIREDWDQRLRPQTALCRSSTMVGAMESGSNAPLEGLPANKRISFQGDPTAFNCLCHQRITCGSPHKARLTTDHVDS